jgi:hypothetical protein
MRKGRVEYRIIGVIWRGETLSCRRKSGEASEGLAQVANWTGWFFGGREQVVDKCQSHSRYRSGTFASFQPSFCCLAPAFTTLNQHSTSQPSIRRHLPIQPRTAIALARGSTRGLLAPTEGTLDKIHDSLPTSREQMKGDVVIHLTSDDSADSQVQERNRTRNYQTFNTSVKKLYSSLPLHPNSRSIRLVGLDASSHRQDGSEAGVQWQPQLTGRIRVARLDHAPTFTALSYIWGEEATPCHTISCL